MTLSPCSVLLSASILVASLLPAAANAPKGGIAPSEACTRSVNAIGASLGHTEKTSKDGKLILEYVVRSNGADYTVACDAATGVVGEAIPRTARAGSAL